jgi:hypothetical protein
VRTSAQPPGTAGSVLRAMNLPPTANVSLHNVLNTTTKQRAIAPRDVHALNSFFHTRGLND